MSESTAHDAIPELAPPGDEAVIDDRTQSRTPPYRHTRPEIVAIGVFAAIFLVGIFLVKWNPYLHKGITVASSHRLGASILTGDNAAAPKGAAAALDYAYHYGLSIWQALVVGLLLAAGAQVLLPRDWLLRVCGSGRFRPVAIGGAAAVPSMMCTCCAAPVAVSLARSQVSVGTTMAYWLGNPVLNPATIVFMGFVLGWRWAVLRIVLGIALVLCVALGAQRMFGSKEIPETARQALASVTETGGNQSIVAQYFVTLRRLAITLVPEYAVIVLVLGAARAFLFPAMSPSIGHAVWLIFVLAVTGMLFVIPTAGEIPIVGSFMSFGLGAAGGAALMITLPAVSLPSLAMLGRAVAARVLIFTAGAVVLFGLLAAALAPALGL